MSRLAWKELRENLWVPLITLLIPVTLLLYARIMLKAEELGLGGMAGLLLIFENVVFAVWGAMRMPPERATGWITLRTLPVRAWQVWLLKFGSGIGWAFLCGAFIWGLATIGTRIPANSLAIWKIAGGCSLGYTVSFAASLFLSGPASGVVGVLSGTVGWFFVPYLVNPRVTGWDEAVAGHLATWAISAILGIMSLAVMTAQSKGAHSRRTGGAFTAACLTILAVFVGIAIERRLADEPRFSFFLRAYPNLVARTGADHYAYSEVAFPRLARKDGKESQPIGTRMVVRSVEGKTIGSLMDRTSRLTPLAWARDGRLLYLSRAYEADRMWLKTWDITSGEVRPLIESEVLPNEGQEYALGSNLAVEPNGDRIAAVRIRSGRLGFGRFYDLYIINTRTGRYRMLRPDIEGNQVLWRAGRIYLRSDGLKVVDPDSGQIKKAHSLPTGKEDESA